MKQFLRILSFLILLVGILSLACQAQIIDPKLKVKRKGEQRINKKIDQGIDKGFDKVEEGIGGIVKKKDKKASKEDAAANLEDEASGAKKEPDLQEGDVEAELVWAKYDFIPGDKVIFEDNLKVEKNGEFPSRWDLQHGNVEIAEYCGENVIMFKSGGSRIVPFLKNPEKDYLPDIFTIEMDVYFHPSEQAQYFIILHDLKNQKGSSLNKIDILPGGLRCSQSTESYGDLNLWDKPEKPVWRHIAVSFNTRALKVYFDDERLINIPNLGFNPTGITVEILNATKPTYYFAKNIRIAEGGQGLYEKFLQDGKIVTNGIRFDVNKATLKSESMGIINEIADLMKENPEIKFIVEGHTDSDGDDSFNMNLSEKRAETVVETLMKLGISKERLTFRGLGESKPIDTNNTSEGKANNRRVEFVKF